VSEFDPTTRFFPITGQRCRSGGGSAATSVTVRRSSENETEPAVSNGIRVGLIDCHQFSRDCLIMVFRGGHPDLFVVPFATVADCVQADPGDLDVILYYSHDDGLAENPVLQQVKALRHAFSNVPIVVLSDAKSALLVGNIRDALNSGAQGFISTLTSEVPSLPAAIRFVKDGGTFAPLDLLLAGGTDPVSATPEPPAADRLTPRQRAVLSHLHQGKANKIIAYELGMSESTVKVHIHNIMRKTGATNRTQAVYHSQQLDTLQM
jgi:DNA-binding NarL/FixJ family response regulator